MRRKFPRLHSFALDSLASVQDVLDTHSVQDVLDTHEPLHLFHIPLSRQAFDEFHEFREFLSNIHRSPEDNDSWSFSWGTSFSSSEMYRTHFQHIHAPNYSSWLWNSKCTLKLKCFAWFFLNDRLNTKDMLQRRQFHPPGGFSRALCNLILRRLGTTFSGSAASALHGGTFFVFVLIYLSFSWMRSSPG